MTNIERIVSQFKDWLEEYRMDLTAKNSIDIHINELLPECKSSLDQLAVSMELFQRLISNFDSDLKGLAVMLMVPLINAESIDQYPPEWSSLPAQMIATPPSIYVMFPTAMVQPDYSQRFIMPIDIPQLCKEEAVPYYQCWPNLGDPPEEGWSRDVRVISPRFL